MRVIIKLVCQYLIRKYLFRIHIFKCYKYELVNLYESYDQVS